MKSKRETSRRFAPATRASSLASGRALLVLVLSAAGCGSGGSSARLAPAPYDLGGAKTVALVEASGTGPVDRFVDALIAETRKRGYAVVDARRLGVKSSDLAGDPSRAAAFLKEAGADALLEARLEGCTSLLGSTKVRETATDGSEFVKTLYGYRGECNARLEIVDANGRALASFEVKGTHRDVTHEEARSQEQEPVRDRAVDATAAAAAGRLAPRPALD